MSVTKVFGPPGSGKTTYLLNVVQQELANNVHPTKIGYFSFTRKAANEARDRAVAKFPHLNADVDFPWFRTLHSLAYRCLGIGSKDMMTAENYRELAQEAGIEISVGMGDDDFMVQADNPILNEINLARIKGLDLRTHYNQSVMGLEWFHFEYVERAYRHYKQSHGLLDFTDLLELIVQEPERLPSLEALIIDEAQDLSRLQWMLVEKLVARSERCFLAGDDQQAIYTWAGADVGSFLDHDGSIVVLEQSWRVPKKVHELATQVGNRIRKRQEKRWKPREEVGQVRYHNDFRYVDVTKGEWLVLAAANYMLTDMHDWLKSQGLLFERHGQRSIPEAVLHSVIGWERLRSGQSVDFKTVQVIYKYLDSKAIKHGHKSLKTADPQADYTLSTLQERHGLLSTDIWHEALTKIAESQRSYIISMLRRGTRLTGKPAIKLSTIHGAKGGEADNVLLMLDLTTQFAKDYDRNSDDINRLLYVGITRAKHELHLVLPKNQQKAFRL